MSEFAVARCRLFYSTQEVQAEKSKQTDPTMKVRSTDTCETVRLKVQDHENFGENIFFLSSV